MANQSKIISNARIYRDCRALLGEVVDITLQFPRAYKYSVGNRMQDIAINLLNTAARAYTTHDFGQRAKELGYFVADFEVLKTLMRLAGERKWVGLGRLTHIIQLMDAIGRQSSAWRNSTLRRVGENHNATAE